MNEPHLWWYVTRASAIIAWVLMTGSVVWGILLSTRIMRRIDNPAWLQDLHRYLGGAALVMVLLHMGSLMLDGWLKFSVADLLVPFATEFKALPVALGIVAFYLLTAVYASSVVLHRLPRRFWKGVHYASYGTLLLVSFHAGLTGTDVGAAWYRVLAIALLAIAATAVLVRVVTRSGPVAADPRPESVASAAARQSDVRPATRAMIVEGARIVADEVYSIRLVPADGEPLPIWQPGAHITLHLPTGLERQYSLCGDPADRGRADIAVLHTRNSAGGSRWIHENVGPGMALKMAGPFNHFELEPAADYLFIAGGIGITPIKAMIESLPQRRSWRLVYLGRSRSTMAFVDELLANYPDQVSVHPGDEPGKGSDLDELIGQSDAEVYCCGPESLMAAVASRVPAARMHLERFVAVERAAAPARPVRVVCRRSGTEFSVAAGQSILAALEENGLPVLGSCRKGVCGNCEVRVLAGDPEHLDSVLDDADKDRFGVMYPCVSRATSDSLVLDL